MLFVRCIFQLLIKKIHFTKYFPLPRLDFYFGMEKKIKKNRNEDWLIK